MVKIDFEHFKTHTLSGVETEKDIKLTVAEDLYEKGQGIAFHALALKIYNSQGETEFTDAEFNLIMTYAKQLCTPMVIDALEVLESAKEEKV
jgi:hypothetical protein